MERADLWIKTIAATVAAIWGGLGALMQLLLILMLIDCLTGVLGAAQRRELSSEISFRGMTKKAIALLLVGTAAAIEIYASDMVGGLPLDEAVAGFYCAHEGLSILENAVGAGLPVPQVLRDVLAKLSPDLDARET